MKRLEMIIGILLLITPLIATFRIIMDLLHMQQDTDNAKADVSKIKNVIIATILVELVWTLVGLVEHYFL